MRKSEIFCKLKYFNKIHFDYNLLWQIKYKNFYCNGHSKSPTTQLNQLCLSFASLFHCITIVIPPNILEKILYLMACSNSILNNFLFIYLFISFPTILKLTMSNEINDLKYGC